MCAFVNIVDLILNVASNAHELVSLLVSLARLSLQEFMSVFTYPDLSLGLVHLLLIELRLVKVVQRDLTSDDIFHLFENIRI
jgi:hypothetical protein